MQDGERLRRSTSFHFKRRNLLHIKDLFVRPQEERIRSRHNIAFEYNRRLISISYLPDPCHLWPFRANGFHICRYAKCRLSCLPSKTSSFRTWLEIVPTSFLLDRRQVELTNEYLERAELSQKFLYKLFQYSPYILLNRKFFFFFFNIYRLNISSAKIFLRNAVVPRARVTTSLNLFQLYISM